MIQRLFDHSAKTILGGAFILALAALASRGLGFLRNALLASFFGASEVLDAYFLSFRLPDFVFNLLFFGALSAGFVPVFMKLRERDEREAWKLTNDIFNLALLAFSVFGIAFFFAAPWILRKIAAGFSAETLELAVTMSRIMFLQPIFLGISGIFSGVLQSVRKFFSYSLAPVFYNVGIIFGILVLEPLWGPAGLAWGVVVGAFLHMGIQYPAARSSGWRWRPILAPGLRALKRVLSVMVPRSLALIVQQINLIILISLATFLGVGSVTVFNFANDLYGFPLGVVVVPIAVAAFPVFVSALNKGREQLADVFVRTARQLLFFLTPLVALALVLRAQVVRLTLGYGKFGWEETIATIDTLTIFLFALLFQGLLGLVLRGFFAFEDAKTPLVVLVLGTAVSVGAALLLRPVWGVVGLAAGFALGMVFESLVLFLIFAQRIRWRAVGGLIRSFLVFALGAVLAGLVARGVLFWAAEQLVTTQKVWGLLVQAILATIVGGGVYLFVNWLFKMPELYALGAKLGLRPPAGAFLEPPPEEELPK